MKEETSHKNPEKHDERECFVNSVSSQNEAPCPSAAAPTPADGQGVNNVSTEIYPIQNNDRSMAESVTRHTLISRVEFIDVLTCGVDSLDVGFYVEWNSNWATQRDQFDKRKANSQGTEGLLIEESGIRPHIFYTGGKAPNYRYHIKFPECDCYIAITQKAVNSPNVYVSFTSEALHWELSERELIELLKQDIESFGGVVMFHKISRCDLYADFKIPGGLNLDFLRSHKVGKAKKTSHFMNGEKLETFYIGDKGAQLMMRIYDKGVKIKKDGTEARWLLIWFIDDPQDVWRIEAQIRRRILDQYHINTIEDLHKKKADLWKEITGDWITLRYPDNENQSRRTVHEFWQLVQECTKLFGSTTGAERQYEKIKAMKIDWHISRIANHFVSCSAILRDYNFESIIQKINSKILIKLDFNTFIEKVKKKSIELGITFSSDEIKKLIEEKWAGKNILSHKYKLDSKRPEGEA
jgi:hypothetical protein